MLFVAGCESGYAKSPQQSKVAQQQTQTPPQAIQAPQRQRMTPVEVPLESLPPEKRELERKRRAWANEALLDPSKATLRAAGICKVKMETTLGDVIIDVKREFAANSVDRCYNLVLMNFYDDCQFYSVAAGGAVEFGSHGDPNVSAAWRG